MFDPAMSRRASLAAALSLLPAALVAQSAPVEPTTLPSVKVEGSAETATSRCWAMPPLVRPPPPRRTRR